MPQFDPTEIHPEMYAKADRYLTYLAAQETTLNYRRFAMLIGLETEAPHHSWSGKLMNFLDRSVQDDREHGHPLRCATIVLQAQKIPSKGFWEHLRDQGIEPSRQKHQQLLVDLGKYPWQPSLSEQEIRQIESLVRAHRAE